MLLEASHCQRQLTFNLFRQLGTNPPSKMRAAWLVVAQERVNLLDAAMAVASVPEEASGIKVASLLCALLTPDASSGLPNAPIAKVEKNRAFFSTSSGERAEAPLVG